MNRKDIHIQKHNSETAIHPGEVHLWLVSVTAMEERLDDFYRLLSKDESAKVGRFHFVKDQKQYIVARGVLRIILSHYCLIEPEVHQFGYNQYGKPFLIDNDWLRFNISHSGDRVLFGFSLNLELGVDIEYDKPFESAHEIVERFFSTQEKTQFRSLPDHMKNLSFLKCWTRKEAYIKALGMGMSLPLDAFSVSFIPGKPACLLETGHDMQAKDRWTIKEVNVGNGYVAAVSVEGRNHQFKELWGDDNVDDILRHLSRLNNF